MKKSIKFYSVVLAALMAVGSLMIVSCDKENDAVNPQTEQVATKDVTAPSQFPINEQIFTDMNGTTWKVWGGYGQILGRRAIKLDIKFYELYTPSRVAIKHFVGTVAFELNGSCNINGSLDQPWTTEIKDFLRDYAWYWLHN